MFITPLVNNSLLCFDLLNLSVVCADTFKPRAPSLGLKSPPRPDRTLATLIQAAVLPLAPRPNETPRPLLARPPRPPRPPRVRLQHVPELHCWKVRLGHHRLHVPPLRQRKVLLPPRPKLHLRVRRVPQRQDSVPSWRHHVLQLLGGALPCGSRRLSERARLNPRLWPLRHGQVLVGRRARVRGESQTEDAPTAADNRQLPLYKTFRRLN